MQGSRQEAYDRGITIFSPDGRLYQVEYAREAIRQGEATLGIKTSDSVIFMMDRGEIGPLFEGRSIEKLHKITDQIGVASAGHVADGRHLIDFARRQAQVNELRLGEPIGIETLTKAITDHIQEYTQVGGVRPFGAALLIGGIDNGEPRLFATDPGGAPEEWKATAIGGGESDLLDVLESEYRHGLSQREGIELGLRALASVKGGGLVAKEIGMATISQETGQYEEKNRSNIRSYLSEFGLDHDEEHA